MDKKTIIQKCYTLPLSKVANRLLLYQGNTNLFIQKTTKQQQKETLGVEKNTNVYKIVFHHSKNI